MSSPTNKPSPNPNPAGFVVPPANPDLHGFANPMAGNPGIQPALPPNPYPPGAPYAPTSGGAYPPSGPPYPAPSGPPYSAPNGPPYPAPNGPPYPVPSVGYYPPPGPQRGGQYPSSPTSNNVSYPGSPGFNSSGDHLFKPDQPTPGNPMGIIYDPKDDSGMPLENGETDKNFDFSDKKVRRQFIKKVYAILMFQLTITFGFVALCLFHEGIQDAVRANDTYLIVAVVVTFATLLPMVCCEKPRRQFPMNFIFLTLFTMAQSFLVGVITTMYEEESVLVAIGMTVVVCLSLTVFAFQTKYDITGWGGILLVALIILLVMGIVMSFFPGDKVRVLYSALGALLFSVYLVYDTQLIMGGSHKYSISPEEYIFAALNIYLDILNLFLHILKIMGKKK